MNSVTLFGNLTRDPEVKPIQGKGKDTHVASFTLAVNRYFTKGDGSSDQETTYVPCEAWDSGAVTLGKYLKKGSPILLQGSLKTESWEKDGVKHSRLKLRVSNFTFVGGRDKNDENGVEAGQEVAVGADNEPTPF